ncbi:MAG: class III cytochrome C family protein [Saprospiraceae bacterium]|nr:class III cytochrome C family protein [Candidatus Opimibacter iunctus]
MKWIAGIGIACVITLLILRYPDRMISPGYLSQGHQDLNHNCMSCHAPFGGIANDRCIKCHTVGEIGKDSLRDTGKIVFHDKLISQSCISCHTDHAGLDPATSMKGFKHDLLDESIINKCIGCHAQPADALHTQVTTDCKSCHDTNTWKQSGPFNHDQLKAEIKNNCTACHKSPDDDLHRQSVETCSKCHSTTQWVPSTFAHNDYFVLDRDHNAKCTVCHTNNNYTAYTCYGCHEHTPTGMAAEHNEEGIYNINDCVSCHKSANEEGGENGTNSGEGEGHEDD